MGPSTEIGCNPKKKRSLISLKMMSASPNSSFRRQRFICRSVFSVLPHFVSCPALHRGRRIRRQYLCRSGFGRGNCLLSCDIKSRSPLWRHLDSSPQSTPSSVSLRTYPPTRRHTPSRNTSRCGRRATAPPKELISRQFLGWGRYATHAPRCVAALSIPSCGRQLLLSLASKQREFI